MRGVPGVDEDSAESERDTPSESERDRDVPREEERSQGCLGSPRGVDVARVVPPGGGGGCRV